jgi:hypothetical protein
MATVYLAVQESLGRPAALKVLSAALAADRTFSDRFIREARTIASLSHPNIVAIYDVGISNHDHYLALEYIEGGDLKGRVRRGAIDPRAAVAIVREIATALGYAHAKGFVHRDVKPENILFRESGMAVLTDFGIARAAGAGGTRMTGMGMSIGTPHYMSPEQARGLTVDGRSDLYALGIVFYEMLTGVVPYDAEETLAIGIKHVTEPVPVLPPALRGYQSLIERMLAKDPNARYRTAEELVEAIDNHDPGAKPRGSGPRRTVVMPAAAVAQAAAANAVPLAFNSGTALKWALIGGLAAIGFFAAFWVIQNQGPVRISGGSGVPAAAPATQGARVTDLEAALTKSTGGTPPPAKVTRPPTDGAVSVELAAWNAAQQTGTRDAYQSYLNTYPNGSMVPLARSRVSNLGDADGNEGNAWQLAAQADSRDGYERFLKAYPNGAFAALAKARLKRPK